MIESTKDLIDRLHAEHLDEMDEVAIGYVLISRDEELGSLYVMGVFETQEAAEKKKEVMDKQLNVDVEDGEGWSMTVHRLMPVDR